jgi:hypothetical protein
MEIESSSKTLVNIYQTSRSQISEDSNIRSLYLTLKAKETKPHISIKQRVKLYGFIVFCVVIRALTSLVESWEFPHFPITRCCSQNICFSAKPYIFVQRTWCLGATEVCTLSVCGNLISASSKASRLWRHGKSYLRGREIPGHFDVMPTEHGARTGTRCYISPFHRTALALIILITTAAKQH